MKTPRILRACGAATGLALLATAPAFADQTLVGNVTISGVSTGNLFVTGYIDSDNNQFTFGTEGAGYGVRLLYASNSMPAGTSDTLQFLANRSPASWLWLKNTGTVASPVYTNVMRLDGNNQLILFQSDGTTAGVTLTPASNQISLGTATLSGSGANLTAGGALTVTGGITNTTGSFTSPTALSLSAGGTNQNITLTPSGSGNLLLLPPPSTGNLGIGTTSPVAKFDLKLATNLHVGMYNNGGVTTLAGLNDAGSLATLRIEGSPLAFGGAGGVEHMRIDSAGKVGIGTNAPATKLDVQGDGSDSQDTFRVTRGAGNAARLQFGHNYIQRVNGDGTYGNILMNVNGGNVGIGTTSPYYTLSFGPNLGRALALYESNGTNLYGISTGGSAAGGTDPYRTKLFANGLEAMSLTYAGNVGIGTAAPTRKLDVNGDANIATNLVVQSGAYTGNLFTLGSGLNIRNASSGNLMYLGETGNVGIGTAAPNAKLEIQPSSSNVGLRLKNTGATTNWDMYAYSDGNFYLNNANGSVLNVTSSATNGLLYLTGNNVGIGTTIPTSKLHVDSPGAGDENFITLNQRNGYLSGGRNFIRFTQGTTPALNARFGFDYDTYGLQFRNSSDSPTVTIKDNGNVGIGTPSPVTTLQVVGPITAGSAAGSPNGIDYLYGNYWGGKLFVLGSQYSSGASFLGYGVKAQPGAFGYLSSTSISAPRSAVESNAGFVAILTGASQTSTDGGAVTIAERMRVDSAGNVGIGTTSPTAQLQVAGNGPALGAGVNTQNILASGTSGFIGYSLRRSDDANGGWMVGTSAALAGDFAVYQNQGASAAPVSRFLVTPSGNVGIGTTNPTQKLSVAGTIQAYEVIVNTGWADYVFDPNYRLAPLSEVEQHIKTEKHLPGIPSAQEIAEHGVSMGDMQSKLLSKIEELTLHMIAQEKRMLAQQAAHEEEIAALRQQLVALRTAAAP